MKKYFTFLVALWILSLSIIAIPVKGYYSAPVTFFESTENLQKLNSYRLNQNINGLFEGNDELAGFKGKYQFNIKADVFNHDTYKIDSHMTLNGSVDMTAESAEKPFDSLKATFWADVIMMANDGVYVRLHTLRINAEGVPAKEMDDYLEFQEKLEDELTNIQGIWFYFPQEIIEDEYADELPPVFDKKEFMDDLKEKGLKEAYRKTINEYLTLSALDDSESEKIKQVTDRFFSASFFTGQTVKSGPQKGFLNYTLSKRRVAQFIESAAEIMEENFSQADKDELWGYLNKFYLSVMTHVHPKYEFYDFFRLKLILRNIEMLSTLSFNYSYKISRINGIDPIHEPDEFTSYRILDLPFLPAPAEEY